MLPSKECDYVFGNPPFLGSKIQTPRQREQIKTLANLGGSGGTLDFVCGWYFKAGAYVKGYKGKIAFVSTNSITQGEQVAQLWPSLFNQYHLEIAFAHRTFVWGSDVSSVAHVHVVILGLVQSKVEPNEKRLYDYLDGKGEPVEISVKKLSPYLVDAGVLGDPHLVVHEASRPINGCQRMISGCQPIDNGNYVFDQDEMELFLLQEPNAKSLFRPYIGTTELVNDLPRFILYLGHSQPDKLSSMPLVKDRMKQVSEFRRKSDRVATKILADYPTKLNVDLVPASQFLAIPEASSERRDYVPMAYLAPPTIPSNLVKVIQDAELWQFGILTSRMHMAWMRNIGGRLESRYRYSIGIVYNTFPWPNLNPKDKTKLVKLSQDILDARANHSGSTLADLYDPVTMPPDLRKAHLNLDKAIDMLYRASGFSSDRDRVEHLLALYEAMVNPMMAMMQDRPKAHRRTKL